MRILKLAGPLFILFLISISLTAAIEPNKEIFLSGFSDAPLIKEKYPGTNFTITYVLKNFLDEKMSNINITINSPEDLDIIGSPFGLLNGEAINQTAPFIYETPTGENLKIINGFVNSTYMVFSFDELLNGSSISFSYLVNATEVKSFNISPPTVKYYDHWGDPQTFNSGNFLSIEISSPPEENPEEVLFPTFETNSEVNWWVMGLIGIIVFAVAILSRSLYIRNPLSV